jgi:hypothetical protein
MQHPTRQQQQEEDMTTRCQALQEAESVSEQKITTSQIVIVPVEPCSHRDNNCSNGYIGDRCDGCLRDGRRAVLSRAVEAEIMDGSEEIFEMT